MKAKLFPLFIPLILASLACEISVPVVQVTPQTSPMAIQATPEAPRVDVSATESVKLNRRLATSQASMVSLQNELAKQELAKEQINLEQLKIEKDIAVSAENKAKADAAAKDAEARKQAEIANGERAKEKTAANMIALQEKQNEAARLQIELAQAQKDLEEMKTKQVLVIVIGVLIFAVIILGAFLFWYRAQQYRAALEYSEPDEPEEQPGRITDTRTLDPISDTSIRVGLALPAGVDPVKFRAFCDYALDVNDKGDQNPLGYNNIEKTYGMVEKIYSRNEYRPILLWMESGSTGYVTTGPNNSKVLSPVGKREFATWAVDYDERQRAQTPTLLPDDSQKDEVP